MSQLPTPQNATALRQARKKSLAILRETIAVRFNKDELRTLCFDLGIQYENLPDTLDGMARELVAQCQRKQCIPELIAVCQRLRPKEVWEDIPDLPSKPAEIGKDEAKQATQYLVIMEVCVELVKRLRNLVRRRRKAIVILSLVILVAVILVLFRNSLISRFHENLTGIPTSAPTLIFTATATLMPTLALTPTPSPTLTVTHTPSHTQTATASPTATLTPTQVPTASATITPRPFPTITRMPPTLTPTQPLPPTKEEKEPPRPPRPP